METLSSGEGSSFSRDSAIPPQGTGPPAANNSPQNTKNFNWLKKRYRGPNYISYAQFEHLHACPFDWGQGGLAGCCNGGGELLYLSQASRDKGKGMIMARGHFASSLYASLSRAQIQFGGPSTFGLEVARTPYAYDSESQEIIIDESKDEDKTQKKDELDKSGALVASNGSSFQLGPMIGRGCFNYRWPVTEYYLNLHPNYEKQARLDEKANPKKASAREDDKDDTHETTCPDEVKERHVGTCQMFSCVKDDVFYQVLRLEEDGRLDFCVEETGEFKFPHRRENKVVITMGGPVWFQIFNEGDHVPTKRGGWKTEATKGSATFAADNHQPVLPQGRGPTTDRIKMFKEEEQPDEVIDKFAHVDDGTEILRFWDEKRKIGLEARLHQIGTDGTPQPLHMVKSKLSWDSGTGHVQRRTKLTAYNTICELDRADGDDGLRCATVVASIRFIEGEGRGEAGGGNWPGLPTSRDFFDHVGVSPSSLNGTGSLWEDIFLQHRATSAPVLDLAEFSMIGRSLEKILQVDVIPTPFRDKPSKPSAYAAVVSNLFVNESVDLKSLFWKVRFLVKVYEFLSSFQRSANGSTSPPGIEEFQQKRILETIESVVRYLAKELLDERPSSLVGLMPNHSISEESNYLYVLTTIWYVVKAFAKGKDWVGATQGWEFSQSHLFMRLHPADRSFNLDGNDEAQLLLWFHHASLLNLCNRGILPKSWLEPDHEAKLRTLEKAAKVAAAAKYSSRRDYVADDEIFDRLSFVSDELGLEDHAGLKQPCPGAIAKLSMKRVKERDYTRGLSPGWLPAGTFGSVSGPWEIHALCHHSRLAVLTMEGDFAANLEAMEEANIYKRNILNFLNAEGTLVPCWERAHTQTRRGWLRSEGTAVVASTFISMLKIVQATKPEAGTDTKQDASDNNKPPTAETNTERALVRVEETAARYADRAHQDRAKIYLEIRRMEAMVKGPFEVFEKATNEADPPPPIKWMSFRPPRIYHPIGFFNSLEDTPELYRPPLIGDTPIPASLEHGGVRLPEQMMRENFAFNRDTILQVLPLQCISVLDLVAKGREENSEGFTWDMRHLKYDDLAKTKEEKLEEDLTWALYDSLVDQEVQHRFIKIRHGLNVSATTTTPAAAAAAATTASKLNPQIPSIVLELLVYVLHSESAAVVANHILRFSRFSCQRRDTWVAGITLRGWKVGSNVPPKAGGTRKPHEATRKGEIAALRVEVSDDDPIRLPLRMRDAWIKYREIDENLAIELQISSIIISTNAFGDFSKCTVVSESVDDQKMGLIVQAVRKLWQKFINQPQTARCLVFLLVLGEMCQEIAQDYQKAIETLASVLKLDPAFLNTDADISSQQDHVLEYELAVWSLEALYKLQNSLSATLGSLLDAKEELMKQARDGPGNRNAALERMYQEYVDDFENKLVQLSAVNAKLERRIEIGTRNKDATSAILTMRDSRTSLRQAELSITQNATVQRLTYLTIAYLPVALMASIFAIPDGQDVLYPGMGRNWFVGAIIILSLATYIMAIYVQNILNYFRYPPPTDNKKRKHAEEVPNLWRQLWPPPPPPSPPPPSPLPPTPSSPPPPSGENDAKRMEEGTSRGIVS